MNDEERRVSGRLFDSGKLHDRKWMNGKGFLDAYNNRGFGTRGDEQSLADVFASYGEGSIIGAGSVVTKDIGPGVIAAGNPCRVIREINNSDREKWEAMYEDYMAEEAAMAEESSTAEESAAAEETAK